MLGSAAGGGAERIVTHLMRHLSRDEFEPRVGLLSREGPYLTNFAAGDVLFPTLLQGWTSYHERPPLRRLVPAVAIVPLQQRELIRRFGPQIVVTLTKSMNLAGRASLAGAGQSVRWVAREGNNTGAMIDGESEAGPGRWIQNAAVRACYRRADRVVVISNGVGAGLVDRFRLDSSRIKTIYNAVDVGLVRQRAAAAVSFPTNRPFIVAAGRLTKQKGFDLLIRAYASQLRGRGVSLLVLGQGPERSALHSLASECGVSADVRFPGFVENPWAYFARAAMFVSSSRWEGFGNVIVEAMAASAPVIATDCDFGPREIVRQDESGLLVKAGNVEALGSAMAALLDDRQRACRLAAAGRRRAEDFDVPIMVGQYQAMFRDLHAE